MTDEIKDNYLEELKKEIKELKIRLERIENFLLAFPSVGKYISKNDYSSEDVLIEEAIKITKQLDQVSSSFFKGDFPSAMPEPPNYWIFLKKKELSGRQRDQAQGKYWK